MPREIGFWIVDSFHVDGIETETNFRDKLGMGHNGDYVVLTGKATFLIRTVHVDTGRTWEETVSLEKGQLHKVVNVEGTPDRPGNWDTYVKIVAGEPPDAPSLAELFELKKAWLRQNVFLGEYALTGILSAVGGGVLGYLIKR